MTVFCWTWCVVDLRKSLVHRLNSNEKTQKVPKLSAKTEGNILGASKHCTITIADSHLSQNRSQVIVELKNFTHGRFL